MQELGVVGTIVATDMEHLAAGLRVADRHYIVPSVSSPEYPGRTLENCRKEGITAIFPLIDPDIPVLASLRNELFRCGVKSAVVSEAAAETTGDKWKTYLFFDQLSIPTPKTWLPQDLPRPTIPFRQRLDTSSSLCWRLAVLLSKPYCRTICRRC